MSKDADNLPVQKIKPGELYVSDSPCRITTLLGSCVSVTVHNTDKEFGGMNHFLLPEVLPDRRRGEQDFRFGDLATSYLLDRMLEYDPNPHHLDAKIFGGGRVVPALSRSKIGQTNVDSAVGTLAEYGITPSEKKVEGASGLKIDFNTLTNTVKVKSIKQSDRPASPDVTEREQQRLQQNESRVQRILSPDDETGGIDFLDNN